MHGSPQRRLNINCSFNFWQLLETWFENEMVTALEISLEISLYVIFLNQSRQNTKYLIKGW